MNQGLWLFIIQGKRELGTKHIFAGETRVLSKLVKTPPTVDRNTDYGDFPGSKGILNALGRGRGNKFGIFKRLEREDITLPGSLPIEKDQFYYHRDHLGSSNIITNIAGSVYQHLEYFPYGETWIEEGGSYNGNTPPYKFTGKELDPETGLYYFGARYYDPVLTRWISADPIDRFNSQSPPTALNLYQYGLWNPIRYFDPTGMEEETKAQTDELAFMQRIIQIKHKLASLVGQKAREWFARLRGEVQEAQFRKIDELLGERLTEEREAEAEFMEKVGQEQERVATQYTDSALEAIGTKGIGKALTILGGIKKTSGVIKVSESRLKHVLERHTVEGALAKGKSIFDPGEDIIALIRAAEKVTPTEQVGGNLQRVVNAGRVIGIDRATGKPTTIYTVITDKSGNLITAFPGLPLR